ncbi:hypothetical protein E2R23_12185 [Burkholderia pseudomallei]|nr:hypothetical protein E2R23_12185 [Burkholderia pseudomallei]
MQHGAGPIAECAVLAGTPARARRIIRSTERIGQRSQPRLPPKTTRSRRRHPSTACRSRNNA